MLYHQSLSEQKSREAARKEGWEKIEKYVKQLKAQQQPSLERSGVFWNKR